MIWLQLLYVYLKIGIFGFGGGYAMLSLIQADVVDRYKWISLQEFTDIVAISQMTPGPIGINSATYIGYTAIHNAGYSPFMASPRFLSDHICRMFAVVHTGTGHLLLFCQVQEQQICRCRLYGFASGHSRTDRRRRTHVDEQRELHRLQKFPDLRCRLHPYLEVQGPSDTDDCIGWGCGVDIVLVIMRSPIAWPYALIYRRYRAMQTLEY